VYAAACSGVTLPAAKCCCRAALEEEEGHGERVDQNDRRHEREEFCGTAGGLTLRLLLYGCLQSSRLLRVLLLQQSALSGVVLRQLLRLCLQQRRDLLTGHMSAIRRAAGSRGSGGRTGGGGLSGGRVANGCELDRCGLRGSARVRRDELRRRQSPARGGCR
jgi:hypothetical protein